VATYVRWWNFKNLHIWLTLPLNFTGVNKSHNFWAQTHFAVTVLNCSNMLEMYICKFRIVSGKGGRVNNVWDLNYWWLCVCVCVCTAVSIWASFARWSHDPRVISAAWTFSVARPRVAVVRSATDLCSAYSAEAWWLGLDITAACSLTTRVLSTNCNIVDVVHCLMPPTPSCSRPLWVTPYWSASWK